MNRCEVTCLLVLIAVPLAVANAEMKIENLEIRGTTVVLTCPVNGTWFKNNKPVHNQTTYTIDKYSYLDNGLYKCGAFQKSYYFYTNLKVCENCMEMSMVLAGGIVLGDVLLTLGVILIVYACASKNATTAPPQRAQRRQLTPGTAQPSDSTYQELNAGTRSADLYSDVKKR